MIPRLCVTAFTFAQPFLVETTIGFVGDENAKSYHGRGLIGAWALVYLGIAVSKTLLNKLIYTNDLDVVIKISIQI